MVLHPMFCSRDCRDCPPQVLTCERCGGHFIREQAREDEYGDRLCRSCERTVAEVQPPWRGDAPF